MTDQRPPLDSTRAEYGQADVLGDHLANADRWWREVGQPSEEVLGEYDLAGITELIAKFHQNEGRVLVVLQPNEVARLLDLIDSRLRLFATGTDYSNMLADLATHFEAAVHEAKP